MKDKLLAVLACFALSACTEAMVVKTSPPGAKLFIDNIYVGTTPTTYEYDSHSVPSSLMCRLERGGYLTQENTIKTRVLPGRVVGTFFTAGVLALFKSPAIYKDVYDFELQPAAHREPVPGDTLMIDERLKRLEDLRQKQLITEDEYQSQRAAILHGL